MNKFNKKKATLIFMLGITLANIATIVVAEEIDEIIVVDEMSIDSPFTEALTNIATTQLVVADKNNPQSVLYAFQRFVKFPVDVIVDSLAQKGRYVMFELYFEDDNEKVVYGEDYDYYNDESIDENDSPEIWKSAYYLDVERNEITHEYLCRRNCGGDTQTKYRLLHFADETKFLEHTLHSASAACSGKLEIYDFNPHTGNFSLDTVFDGYISVEKFFKESTPDSLMENFDYCFLAPYDDTNNSVAQYRILSYWIGYINERHEELEKWMLGNVIDIYFVDGKFIRSEPYFDDYW